MKKLQKRLEKFIADSTWIFAKTYAPRWPHEYIVQGHVDSAMFLELAHHIDTFGYEGHFYDGKQNYYDHSGHTYWHMGNIINRCLEADTYDRRKKDGRLPVDKKL